MAGQDQLARWAAEHPTASRTGRILETPLSYLLPRVGAGLLVAYGLFSLNRHLFWVKPNSLEPEFLAEVEKIGNVVQRMNAPPVYRDPFRNKIPGNIIGPDDVKAALQD